MARLSALSRSIDGKVAIVTGAGSGMGRATAHLFADEGAVVVVADRDGDRARHVTKEIEQAGGEATAWAVDVADSQAIVAFVSSVVERHRRIDILVNNS